MKANTRYLTLALDVRKVTDSLILLVEKGQQTEVLRDALPQMLISLKAAGERSSVQRLRDSGVFGRYENIVTMNEVVKPEDREQIVHRLQRVLSSASEQERRDSAVEAIPVLRRS